MVSIAGGFNRWKDEGRDWSTPQSLTPSSATATSATCCCPRSGRGPAEAARGQGAAARRRWPGSPAALYLAAAGVGTLGIVDMDVVDESNLQRQILHNMDRIGDRKVDSAKKTLT